jgi:hypothetical protein
LLYFLRRLLLWPAVTMQDLELEHAELLPVRETLWGSRLFPRYYPGGPVHVHPDPPSASPSVYDA